MRRMIQGLVVLAAVTLPSATVLAKATPSATVKLSGKSVEAGVGVSWGKGTLTYKGKHYPFSVDGLTVGGVGATSVTATGTVYHLKSLEDFNGQYAAASAGATVGGGGGVATMKNANGVTMDLKATTRGVSLKLGPDGIKVTLEK